jgi:CHAT domain-containing protein
LSHASEPGTLEQLDLYLDWALRLWLPNAVWDPSSQDFRASYRLGELLEQKDDDPWMRDFLHVLTVHDAPAVEALSAAIRANRKGLYDLAAKRSKLAASIFAKRGNVAGELRARFETVYASQRFFEGFDCLTQIASIRAPNRYRWLQIQLALEKYTCSNFGGEFAAIQRGLAATRQQAEESHYHLLALRSIALAAGIKRQQQHGCHEVWATAANGFDLYWTLTPYPPDRLYEFYSILEQCAAQVGYWNAAEAFQRNSIALLESPDQDHDPNLILEGSAHAELAAILSAEHKDDEAEKEQDVADALWRQAGNERTANTYRLFMRVHLAEIQLKRGAGERAWSTLESARRLLDSTQYQYLSLNFYRVLGNTCWRLKRLSEAALAYGKGIAIAENSLRSIATNARDRLQWVTKAEEVYRGMIRVWLEQGRTAEAWKLWEWYRTRSLVSGVRFLQPQQLDGNSWHAVQRQTAALHALSGKHLVYASFEDGLQMWTIDGTDIKGHWIQIRQPDLQLLVNDFAEECANPSSSLGDVQAQARKLYGLLLQPVVSELPPSGTVVVEIDRTLSRLVLPALMDSSGRYFAESHFVVYSPGVVMEEALRPLEPIETSDRILLVDASEANGAAVVPGHLEERQAAFRVYHHVRLVSGTQATPAEIKRELSRSSAFDFIGHGEQRGSQTELRLSSRSSLTPEDFTPAVLAHMRLGVLSACSTGASGEDRLLETTNLVHSFLSAGVPEVIATQWNVDSRAASQLMQSFYSHLAARERVSQAMYHAQKEILIDRHHPYFWAGFALFGRAH